VGDPMSFSSVHRSSRKGEKGWEGRGDSWPRGAPTPARSRHGGGGRNGDFALTKAQMDRLKGGGGRGDHGEARGKMAGVFLQWRGRKATATLGRNSRSCGGSALRAVETKECKWSRQVRRAGAGFHLELGRAMWRRR